MSELLSLVTILKKTEYTGYTIQPYLYPVEDTPYIAVRERLTSLNLSSFSDLPAHAREIHKLSDEIEPGNLVTRFSKKTLSLKSFFEQKGNLIKEVVKPFIETRLVEIIELIIKNGIPLYDVSGLPNLYNSDKIIIEKEKASTLLKFDRTDEGTIYRIETFIRNHEINLQHPGNIILTNQPCYLVSKKRLIQFDTKINGKMLTPFLQKDHIEIPKRFENKYFDTFIKRIVNISDIEANGFQVKQADHQPEAELHFDIDWQGSACFILKFAYGKKAILASNPYDYFTDLESDEDGFIFYRYSRDKSLEERYKQALLDLELARYENCFRLPELISSDQVHDMVRWVIDNKDKLEAFGFKLVNDTTKSFSFSKPDIQIKTDSFNDYFDLRIIVKIDDHVIPFIKFKKNILSGNREYMLPDGKVFLLPEAWFERYQDILIHAKEAGNSFHLKKHHFKILEDIGAVNISDTKPLSIEENYPLPSLRDVTLRPYQEAGYQWMSRLAENDFGGILADDMGLGKTLQTIAVLAYYYFQDAPTQDQEIEIEFNKPITSSETDTVQLDLFESPVTESTKETKPAIIIQKETRPCSIIVMPTSLVHNWLNEIKKYAPYLKVLVYTGANRKLTKSMLQRYNLLLTTYGTLRNDINQLSKHNFAYAILDESQNIKNPSSKTAQAVNLIQSDYRFTLTGTPVENSLTDLWSQMNFVNPGLLGDLGVFNSYYANPLGKDPEAVQGEKLLTMIEPFVLRRTKEAVAPELPELSQTVSYCTMSEEQAELYEAEKSKVRNLVFEHLENGIASETPVMVLKALMLLRQIANHPLMTDPESSIESGKYDEVTQKLDTIVSEKHRVLIFSSFVKHLTIYEDYCKGKGYKYSILTGSTTKREKVLSEFKNNDDVNVFLISLKAGGVGLNLTEADYVFMLDPWWNPAAEMQAINRAHRIGQNKNVFVYRFISKDTVEEKILTLQEKKKALADAFIKPKAAIAGMTADEIKQLFI